MYPSIEHLQYCLRAPIEEQNQKRNTQKAITLPHKRSYSLGMHQKTEVISGSHSTGSIFWDNHALCHFAHSTAFSIHTILSNKACGRRRYPFTLQVYQKNIYINKRMCGWSQSNCGESTAQTQSVHFQFCIKRYSMR